MIFLHAEESIYAKMRTLKKEKKNTKKLNINKWSRWYECLVKPYKMKKVINLSGLRRDGYYIKKIRNTRTGNKELHLS